MKLHEKRPTAIDLFSGAGGLSEGFHQAGFQILAANDMDEFSAETFKSSHPETQFLLEPIQELEVGSLLRTVDLVSGELDVLLGGPPCQAFSVYNHQRGLHDDRSGLFKEYLRLVHGLMPRYVVIENVTGILSVANGYAVKEIHSALEDLGYHVEMQILKAEMFGVPQERRRVFILGTRDYDAIDWPQPTHGESPFGPLFSKINVPYVTVEQAIGDLPRLGVSDGLEVSSYSQAPQSSYQLELREGSDLLFNHVAPSLQPINLERLKYIPQGGSWRDIPVSLLPAGMKIAKRSDHTKRYGRLHPDGLASTILTKCDLHWGAYIHPNQERTITVREAARFQSFPDRFRFFGPRGEQFRQVGNAVPPKLAKAVAETIRNSLTGALNERIDAVAD